MQRIGRYVARHHVGLLALLLVLTAGTAYAAKVHLPKNSVASKQVRNGSIQGKDLMDGSVTGADLGDSAVTSADLADGSVTGTDLADGGVGAGDLAATAVPFTRVVLATAVSGGAPATVYDEPGFGSITFSCGPGATTFALKATLAVASQPGSTRVSGHDIVDNNPVGASTVSTGTVQPVPIEASFASSGTSPPTSAIIPQGKAFLYGVRKRLSLDWEVSNCTIHGLLVVTDNAAQPGP